MWVPYICNVLCIADMFIAVSGRYLSVISMALVLVIISWQNEIDIYVCNMHVY